MVWREALILAELSVGWIFSCSSGSRVGFLTQAKPLKGMGMLPGDRAAEVALGLFFPLCCVLSRLNLLANRLHLPVSA